MAIERRTQQEIAEQKAQLEKQGQLLEEKNKRIAELEEALRLVQKKL